MIKIDDKGRFLGSKENLIIFFPEILENWHPTRNIDIRPENLTKGSHKKVWWKCKACSHESFNSPKNRFGRGCGACSNYVIHSNGQNSMRNTNPKLAEEFHSTLNGKNSPDNLTAGSSKKLWWKCIKCEHEWVATADKRSNRGDNCPVCSNRKVHNDGRNSMRNTHPEIAKDFHPTLNGECNPDNLTAGSGRKIWWKCQKCEHEYKVSASSRIYFDSKCKVCSNQIVHEDGRNAMITTHPLLAKEFNDLKNKPHTTSNVIAGTHKKLWWDCQNCKHSWKTTGASRRGGRGCPNCSITGFNLSLPAQYYVIQILNKSGNIILYKAGISNDYKKRFLTHKKNFLEHERSKEWALEILDIYENEDGSIIRNLESRLIQQTKIRAPAIYGLSSELFIENPLEYAKLNGLI
jgi:hypothetical protein